MSQELANEVDYEAQSSKRPKWLVMIYLAGDNNLSANSIAIMQELEAALPPSANVRVLACFDSNTPRPRGTRYVEVNHRRHKNPTGIPDWDLHNDLVPINEIPGHAVVTPDFCEKAPTTNQPIKEPAAKEGLSRFLTYALKKHPAERHMLILFGHGTAVAGNTFLADDNPPSFLRLKDFADVLAKHFDLRDDTHKPALDILACQNCAMNGIETAYQIRGQVKYMLGSQGLMLALGWPYRKIINAVVQHQDAETKFVACQVLMACARNLIDFTLMDRSTEQSLCDLTVLNRDKNLVTAVKKLVAAMTDGLEFDDEGEVMYPAIRDAIRLARLEAQSYWGETFVDLYDFCLLLLEQCNQAISLPVTMFFQSQMFNQKLAATSNSAAETDGEDRNAEQLDRLASKELLLRSDPGLRLFRKIAECCRAVLREIKGKRFVLNSYYIGPDLQYSNGVSVYFPWTLPETPIIFEPDNGAGSGWSGGRYGVSWVSLDRANGLPDDYVLKTAFEEYKEYDFAKQDAGDWAAFLERFFRATLRNVRRHDVWYEKGKDVRFFDSQQRHERFVAPADVNPQKSGSDTGIEEFDFSTIKNYPRRFYVSPADCLRRCDLTQDKEDCASYLGWNVRGLVAQVIGLEKRRRLTGRSGAGVDASETKRGEEPEE